PANPRFYGEPGKPLPTAHDAALIGGKVTDGTIVSAECCYGADLYDPAGGQMGLCNTYLAQGAFGFFGSSTIAYGPPTGNGAADLICQYFLNHIRDGASLGRACLQARLDFVQQAGGTGGALSPIDLKTLAQFSLLGDPSLTPVKPAAA